MIRAMAFVAVVAAGLCPPGPVPRAHASDVQVAVTLSPQTIAAGENASLTITVDGKFRGATPHVPDLDGLEIFSSGSSQSMQWINGRMTSSITYTYVVTATRPGTYRIEPVTVTIGDKEYTAEPRTLEVTPARSGVAPAPRPGPAGGRGQRAAEDGAHDPIFIRARVNQDTVFVNQQVTWSLGYYSDGSVRLLRSPNYSPPSSEGFWVEDLPPQKQYDTRIDGRAYRVNEILRAYFPTAPGEYTIGSANVDVVVDDVSRRSLIDDFFGRGMTGGFGGTPHTLSTDPISIVVRPLPDGGKPAGFAGAVASDLTVSMSVDKPRVHVGEPINLKVELNGRGNVKTIPAPSLDQVESFKVYESGSRSDTFKKDYVVTGRKQMNYVVVPRSEGDWTIPAIKVSYFDPAARTYRVARSHDVHVHVDPGAEEDSRRVVYAGGGDDFEVINRDIRYIHPAGARVARGRPAWIWSRTMAAAPVIPLLALGGAVWFERRRRKLNDNAAWARASRAGKRAAAALREARAGVKAGRPDDAVASIAEALAGYLADRMDVSQAGLTGKIASDWLRARGQDELADRVLSLLGTVDAVRFGATRVGDGTVAGLIEDAQVWVDDCERRIPR